ncbi:MAG: hypothetical protein HC815_09340 [Richelia sp. RM1_1_1]|nr:hypothetical protein [Richelia sp. RM1_1_1]
MYYLIKKYWTFLLAIAVFGLKFTKSRCSQTELFDIIERERKHLKALGVRKLRGFCKNCKIKGYATSCKQGGIDGLVEFLLQRPSLCSPY